ncbi:unnamed protein product [Peronospora belbahrii]|uniref:Copine C-terminal domain-containing protein n=1 Tax=Peronospora belbahrii TaxID=622444 RepID=A0ABN8CQV1_9STRA|nr:unnamed protein product [Peronospora belbahrii]
MRFFETLSKDFNRFFEMWFGIFLGYVILSHLLYVCSDFRHRTTYSTNFSNVNDTVFENSFSLNMNLESSNLMFAVDYTTANLTCGEKSFDGKGLHSLDPIGKIVNPYEEVLSRLGRVLAEFDDDRSIQIWGFGDAKTLDDAVFSFTPEHPMDGWMQEFQRDLAMLS